MDRIYLYNVCINHLSVLLGVNQFGLESKWMSGYRVALLMCISTLLCVLLLPPCRYGPPTRTEHRLIVENISSRISWQVGKA